MKYLPPTAILLLTAVSLAQTDQVLASGSGAEAGFLTKPDGQMEKFSWRYSQGTPNVLSIPPDLLTCYTSAGEMAREMYI